MAINWISKKAQGRGLCRDVRIKICRIGKKYKTCITFANNWEKTISKTEHILVGVDGSRIYFKDDANGYKIDCNGATARLYIGSDELLEIARERGGDYKMQKDKVSGLWFIETNVDSSFDKYK